MADEDGLLPVGLAWPQSKAATQLSYPFNFLLFSVCMVLVLV